jgi:hypothetical protein
LSLFAGFEPSTTAACSILYFRCKILRQYHVATKISSAETCKTLLRNISYLMAPASLVNHKSHEIFFAGRWWTQRVHHRSLSSKGRAPASLLWCWVHRTRRRGRGRENRGVRSRSRSGMGPDEGSVPKTGEVGAGGAEDPTGEATREGARCHPC